MAVWRPTTDSEFWDFLGELAGHKGGDDGHKSPS